VTTSKRLAELAAELRAAGYKVEDPPSAPGADIVNIPPKVHEAVAEAITTAWMEKDSRGARIPLTAWEAAEIALVTAIPLLAERNKNVIVGYQYYSPLNMDLETPRPEMHYMDCGPEFGDKPHPASAHDTRNPDCVKQWPDCVNGEFNPQCCHWPKSCSC